MMSSTTWCTTSTKTSSTEVTHSLNQPSIYLMRDIIIIMHIYIDISLTHSTIYLMRDIIIMYMRIDIMHMCYSFALCVVWAIISYA